MSAPRRDALENNLSRLLRRAYLPVRPDPAFVARLERRLAPWIGPRASGAPNWGRGARTWVAASLMAAAALLLWLLPPWAQRVTPGAPAPQVPLAADGQLPPAPRGGLSPAPGPGLGEGSVLAPRSEGGAAATPGDPVRPEPGAGGARVPLAAGTDDRSPGSEAQAGAPTGATLTGRLSLPEGAAAPARVEVTLLRAVPLPAVAWPEARSFELAAEGPADGGLGFRWGELEPGVYLVQVAVPGFAPRTLRGQVLVPGAGLELDFALEPGARLRGHVVDAATGAPLVGALVISEVDAPVQVLGTEPEDLPVEMRARALTGNDGRFELEGLSSGVQRLRASHPERAPRWLEVQDLGPGEERGGLLLELTPGGDLEGRIEDSQGAPRSDSRVVASHASGDEGHGLMSFRTALTDGEGRYRIAHLAPGAYVVLDLGPEDGALPSEMRPRFSFAVVGEGETARVDFLAPAGLPTLAGRFVDGEGTPVPRGVAQLVPRRADGRWAGEESMRSKALEADGSFLFSGLEAGTYALYGGTGDATVLLDQVHLPRPGRVEGSWTLAGTALTGRVLWAEDDQPLVRAVLLLRPRGAYPASGAPWGPTGDLVAAKGWTAADGSFRIEHLGPGPYTLLVVADAPGVALGVVDELQVPASGPLEVRLGPAGTLELEVVDEAGRPLAACDLWLVDPRGVRLAGVLDVRTDAEGRARLTRLEPGPWTVVAGSGGRRSGPLRLEVVAGEARRARLVLPGD